jgi:uncharacterized protein YbbK (DUF523 family)
MEKILVSACLLGSPVRYNGSDRLVDNPLIARWREQGRIVPLFALEMAVSQGCRFALLTDGSPSCGTSFVYSGRFDGAARKGNGVVAALLAENGIAVFSEREIERLAEALGEAA